MRKPDLDRRFEFRESRGDGLERWRRLHEHARRDRLAVVHVEVRPKLACRGESEMLGAAVFVSDALAVVVGVLHAQDEAHGNVRPFVKTESALRALTQLLAELVKLLAQRDHRAEQAASDEAQNGEHHAKAQHHVDVDSDSGYDEKHAGDEANDRYVLAGQQQRQHAHFGEFAEEQALGDVDQRRSAVLRRRAGRGIPA